MPIPPHIGTKPHTQSPLEPFVGRKSKTFDFRNCFQILFRFRSSQPASQRAVFGELFPMPPKSASVASTQLVLARSALRTQTHPLVSHRSTVRLPPVALNIPTPLILQSMSTHSQSTDQFHHSTAYIGAHIHVGFAKPRRRKISKSKAIRKFVC